MFRNTFFGRWLDIPNIDGDPLLLHYVFFHEVVTDSRSKVEEMVFKIGLTSYLSERKNFVSSLASGLVTILLLLHLAPPFFPVLFLWSQRMSRSNYTMFQMCLNNHLMNYRMKMQSYMSSTPVR